MQAQTKRDFKADTRQMALLPTSYHPTPQTPSVMQMVVGREHFTMSDGAHDQLATRLGIPRTYYDRMLADAPNLLAQNANNWLDKEPDTFLIRTLNQRARAVLSKSYRIIDHIDLLRVILPEIKEKWPDLKIQSLGLTEDRLYLKATLDSLTREVRQGDPVRAGIVITNSETGMTALKVQPLVERLICTNGMISADGAFTRRHVGVRSNVAQGEVAEYRADTIEADNKALILKARDTIGHILNDEAFEKVVAKMRGATDRAVEEPIAAVREVSKLFKMTESERDGILGHFMHDHDHTQYGLLNAVTRHAQDVDSYQRSTELEVIGHEILTLPVSDWTRIARAYAAPA